MKLLLVLAAAGTALLAGCASRPFIMGIYDAPRSAFPELSRAGFNVVTLGAGETNRAAYLNAAQTNGIKVILSPALETAEGRAKTVREDRHPALLAWYLVDEPDLNVISPRVLAEKARKVRGIL